jgi:hypothetical protein
MIGANSGAPLQPETTTLFSCQYFSATIGLPHRSDEVEWQPLWLNASSENQRTMVALAN